MMKNFVFFVFVCVFVVFCCVDCCVDDDEIMCGRERMVFSFVLLPMKVRELETMTSLLRGNQLLLILRNF